MANENFPVVDEQLLKALGEVFPERSPNPGEPFDQLMVRAGQATVLRFLTMQFEKQNENILERSII